MKKFIILLTLFFTQVVLECRAQSSATHDGISVVVSTVNDSTFYYGEPFKVFLEIRNTKSTANLYYEPQPGVNLNYFLRQKATGKQLATGPNYWEVGASQRTRMTAKPSIEAAFGPGEEGFLAIEVNSDFGYEALTRKPYSQAGDLGYRLLALPVGQYELVVDYYLMPSSKKITVSFPFEIVPVPAEEQKAFNAYIESTIYASSAQQRVNNSYAASNADSYENFIKKHPNSVFAHYAFFDMVGQVYFYGSDRAAMVGKFREYLNYYPRLKKSSLKMQYMQSLPYICKHIPGKNPTTEMDAFLRKIKDEKPAYSRLLLQNAEKVHKIKGLKNYAGKKA